MLFTITMVGVALSVNPYTTILGALVLLVAFPWFLVRLTRESAFVRRSDATPLAAGVGVAALLALVLDVVDRDAEPAFIALFVGIGLMLHRFGKALASSPRT
ncbi:MAG: hypothetical protein H0T39_10225 [Actinobacteria bacterium]|nr:hypothetical protein [Actinomycetota bacterium]